MGFEAGQAEQYFFIVADFALISGRSVSEGCLKEEKPVTKKLCERFYDCDSYAECLDGKCTCISGFTGRCGSKTTVRKIRVVSQLN